jgi:PHD/YefM family antitoxin component YafN of YafNO toxin-antitoxin module
VLSSARIAPQTIRNRGVDVAVVISVEELARLQRAAEEKPRPMDQFLALTRTLKAKGDLSIKLPRRSAVARPSPFEE